MMIIFTIKFFFIMFLFGSFVAMLDEYVFKNTYGFSFRLFQATLFSVMMTCLVPVNFMLLNYIK